jgi:hypothetical protein
MSATLDKRQQVTVVKEAQGAPLAERDAWYVHLFVVSVASTQVDLPQVSDCCALVGSVEAIR